jgi:hypothetical protein
LDFGGLNDYIASFANSNYNAFTFSFRERLRILSLDVNYTYAHSLDDASGLQSETGFLGFGNNVGNGAFILNAIRQGDNYASSDFDIRHSINADAVWQLPFGKGQAFMGNSSRAMDAILGGWQLSGIFRWNTGLPVYSPTDDGTWSTNWASTGFEIVEVSSACANSGNSRAINGRKCFTAWPHPVFPAHLRPEE